LAAFEDMVDFLKGGEQIITQMEEELRWGTVPVLITSGFLYQLSRKVSCSYQLSVVPARVLPD
jgi:hypothetical protein